MTRINSNLNPQLLHRRHLLAELREITMVPASLKRSLKTKNPVDILNSIPKQFTLNSGHVKFFYNKLGFLEKRFDALCNEMETRGYIPDRSRVSAFHNWDDTWCGDWASSPTDDQIVMDRIQFRISQKPHLYT